MVPFLRGTSVNFRGVYPRLACKHHHRGLCDWLHHDAGCHVYIFIGTLEYCCGDAGHGHEIAAESAGVSKGKNRWKQWCVHPGYVGLYRGILLYQSIPLDLRNGIVESYPSLKHNPSPLFRFQLVCFQVAKSVCFRECISMNFSARRRSARNPPLTQPSALARKHRKRHVRKTHLFWQEKMSRKRRVWRSRCDNFWSRVPGNKENMSKTHRFSSKLDIPSWYMAMTGKSGNSSLPGLLKIRKAWLSRLIQLTKKKFYPYPPGVKTGQPLPRLQYFSWIIGWQPTKIHG